MSQLSKSTYKTLYGSTGSTFPDNTTEEISEGDLRQFGEDNADSFMTINDNFIDEDSFASDSATKAASQQSIKAYIDGRFTSILLEATLSISSSELLNLNSTPKQLVPAPGAGKFIAVREAWAYYDYLSIAYATNTNVMIEYALPSLILSLNGMIDQSSDIIYTSSGGGSRVDVSSNILNQSVRVRVNTGNPTAGDGTLKIGILYSVITI